MASDYAGYFGCALKPRLRGAVIDQALDTLKPRRAEFDAIAFMGMSGAAVAPVLAYLLNKPLICVRKEGERAHTGGRISGPKSGERYVIVDDFMSTGNTCRNLAETIKDDSQYEHLRCVGILFYCHSWTIDEKQYVLPAPIWSDPYRGEQDY